MEFVDKRAPGMEFVGKRSPGMDFVNKRLGMKFFGKRSPLPLNIKRAPGKSSLVALVHLEIPVFIVDVLGMEFLGKRSSMATSHDSYNNEQCRGCLPIRPRSFLKSTLFLPFYNLDLILVGSFEIYDSAS